MSGNYLPWLAIACAVLAVLYYKGYFPIGFKATMPQKLQSWSPIVQATAHDLGVAYHKALHDEAMGEVYEQMSADRSKLIKERITAPFSPPDPAGPTEPVASKTPGA